MLLFWWQVGLADDVEPRPSSAVGPSVAAVAAATGTRPGAMQQSKDMALPASMDDDRLWHGWSDFEVRMCDA